MEGAASKTGHFLAKVLGIDLNDFHKLSTDDVSRGESVLSTDSGDTFVEEPPTTGEWFREVLPSGPDLFDYSKSLFPFVNWIGHYNMPWFIGDAVAGEYPFFSFRVATPERPS